MYNKHSHVSRRKDHVERNALVARTKRENTYNYTIEYSGTEAVRPRARFVCRTQFKASS